MALWPVTSDRLVPAQEAPAGGGSLRAVPRPARRMGAARARQDLRGVQERDTRAGLVTAMPPIAWLTIAGLVVFAVYLLLYEGR